MSGDFGPGEPKRLLPGGAGLHMDDGVKRQGRSEAGGESHRELGNLPPVRLSKRVRLFSRRSSCRLRPSASK